MAKKKTRRDGDRVDPKRDQFDAEADRRDELADLSWLALLAKNG